MTPAKCGQASGGCRRNAAAHDVRNVQVETGGGAGRKTEGSHGKAMRMAKIIERAYKGASNVLAERQEQRQAAEQAGIAAETPSGNANLNRKRSGKGWKSRKERQRAEFGIGR